MHNSKVFYLQACVMLFMSAEFSNAVRMRITNPEETFAYAASIYSLFVKGPNQNNFTLHSSAKPMFLAVHQDCVTLSFYEPGAPYTLLTFPQRKVDFELMFAETMVFNVTEANGIWHFRCIFSADRETLDIIFAYLSVTTGLGFMANRMSINSVEKYVKMDHMQDPITELVQDLQPALMYDQETDEKDPSKKIFSVTKSNIERTQRRVSRLVFRTGNFEVCQVFNVVVLKLSICKNWFYLFYTAGEKFAKRLMEKLAPFAPFDVPPDVRSYVLKTRATKALLNLQNESKSDSGGSQPEEQTSPLSDNRPSLSQSVPQTPLFDDLPRNQPRPDEDPGVQTTHEDGRPKRRKRRTTFTEYQLNRLQQEFSECRLPSRKAREKLARELGLTEVQVNNWFGNTRDKLKWSKE